ncbi:MAG: adenylyltransferase/cytidyltransferase family protein [Gemmatimonadota bacterium]
MRTLAEAVAWRASAPGPVVFTNGVFDLVHRGHVELLEQARQLGGSLVVALNTDDSVRRLGKGPGRPIVSESDRARVLAGFGCVDCVVLFSEATPLQTIELLTPDVLVKGGDYRPETVVGADAVCARGGRVEIIPLVPQHSTTNIVESLRVPS